MLTPFINEKEYSLFKELYAKQFLSENQKNISLSEALEYCLSLKGGFVRAQIVLASFQDTPVSSANRVNVAMAVEYFQLSSIILDDLPSMDDAEFRRGKKCVHHVYGESDAVLTALSLINRAYILLWRVLSSCDQVTQEKCLNLIDSSLGFEGIISGQAMDLSYNEALHEVGYIEDIARLKTTSLFSVAMILPLLISSTPQVVIERVESFVFLLGQMYQLIDDLKDYYLEQNEHLKDLYVENLFIVGKKSRDRELSRPNYVLKIGIDASEKKLMKIISEAEEVAASIAKSNSKLSFYEIIVSGMKEKYMHIRNAV